MIIINADDWGGWRSATDAALACHSKGRVTSVSAMVFMEDSERAAELAKQTGVDVGLHLNFNQTFSGVTCPSRVTKLHERIRRFLTKSKHALLFYNPFLRENFRYVYQAQLEEFVRLYGQPPSHFDGHQHMHLCTNVLLDGLIPVKQKVRRSFSFWPGEKSFSNRFYRRCVDGWLARRYRLTDYFFSLEQCLKHNRLQRVVELSTDFNVELMTHPEKADEYDALLSEDFAGSIKSLSVDSYAAL